jgi:hypothetical protein
MNSEQGVAGTPQHNGRVDGRMENSQTHLMIFFCALPCPEPIERAGRRHAMRSVLD